MYRSYYNQSSPFNYFYILLDALNNFSMSRAVDSKRVHFDGKFINDKLMRWSPSQAPFIEERG